MMTLNQLLKKGTEKTRIVIWTLFSQRARFGRKNRNITIISNNCIAGFLYKDLGIPFSSPTVGLQFTQEGFVEFCRDFANYIKLPITHHPDPPENDFRALGGETINFPVGKLGGLTLFLQHYETVEEAATAWARRTKRIDDSKLFFVFMAYDTTDSTLIRNFASLELRNSLVLTINDRPDLPFSMPLYCGDNPWYSIEPKSHKPYYWRFDFIDWMRSCIRNQQAEQVVPPNGP